MMMMKMMILMTMMIWMVVAQRTYECVDKWNHDWMARYENIRTKTATYQKRPKGQYMRT